MAEAEQYFTKYSIPNILSRGMAELYQAQPLNPIEFLATFLLKNNSSNNWAQEVYPTLDQPHAHFHTQHHSTGV